MHRKNASWGTKTLFRSKSRFTTSSGGPSKRGGGGGGGGGSGGGGEGEGEGGRGRGCKVGVERLSRGERGREGVKEGRRGGRG